MKDSRGTGLRRGCEADSSGRKTPARPHGCGPFALKATDSTLINSAGGNAASAGAMPDFRSRVMGLWLIVRSAWPTSAKGAPAYRRAKGSCRWRCVSFG
jgi:hypothetical protein